MALRRSAAFEARKTGASCLPARPAAFVSRPYATQPPPPPPTSDDAKPAQQSDPTSDPTTSKPDAPGAPEPRRTSSAFDIDTTLATIAEDAGQGSKGRTGAKARSSRGSRGDGSRFSLLGLTGLGLLGIGAFELYQLAGDWKNEQERERFAQDPSADSALGRIKLRLKAMYDDFNAPVWEKLLPDPLPFPYQRPYTLVVDLDELLVHSHWTREHGWRTAKRPGLDYFLGYLSQFWEIVIYTSQPFYAVGPIIEKLDPDRRWIAYTLFRESCRTMPDGSIVKDLSRLNRDLSKVLVLDTNSASFSQHPDNGIVVNKWNGRRDDRELPELLPFLEAIGIYGIGDVRSTVKAYQGVHVATEYNRRQLEIKEQQLADWQQKKGTSSTRSWFGGLSSTASSSQSSSASSPGGGPPKSWFDLERERYQQGYLDDEKYWRENGEKLRKAAQEEQEAKMKEMKLSVLDLLSGKQFQQPAPQ